MNYVAKDNGLADKDVKYLGEITQGEFSDYIQQNTNKTQLGVIFCTSEWDIKGIANVPCKFETQTDKKLIMYNIIMNITEYIRPPAGDDFRIAHPKHPFASSLKLSLDTAIISYFNIDQDAKGDRDIDLYANKEENPMIQIDTQDFPKTHFRFLIGGDVVTLFGGLQFAVPYMVTASFSNVYNTKISLDELPHDIV